MNYRKNTLVVDSNQVPNWQGTVGDSRSKCEIDKLPNVLWSKHCWSNGM